MEALKTKKGSRIQRSKYGVGKLIGGDFYCHKDYALDIIPESDYNLAIDILEQNNFVLDDFKCVKYSPDKSQITFQEAPDFDDAREPKVGKYVVVNLDKGTVKEGYSNAIWHHKWLWVKDDYKGFNVQRSYDWSKKWLSELNEPADGTNIGRWNTQLTKYNLPIESSAILCDSKNKPPINSICRKVAEYLYNNIDGAYDFKALPNKFQVYFLLLYSEPIKNAKTEEMHFVIDITTYANKIRLNLTEITPDEFTILHKVFSPEDAMNLLVVREKVMKSVMRKLNQLYADYDFIY